jgi:hypothetical protein
VAARVGFAISSCSPVGLSCHLPSFFSKVAIIQRLVRCNESEMKRRSFLIPFLGEPNAALVMLSKLRELPPTHPDLKSEFAEIRKSVEAEREIGNASWSEMLEKRILIRVAIGGIFTFLLLYI